MPWRIYAALTREQWQELEDLTQKQAAQRLEQRAVVRMLDAARLGG